MIAILAAAVFVFSLVFLRRQTGLYVFMALIFLLFGFGLRMASVVYVGSFGPIYSVNFARYIRDEGFASLVFSLSLVVLVAAASWLLKPRSILKDVRPLPPVLNDHLSKVAFFGFAALIFLLYADMLIRGVIPLFSYMERDVYTEQYAGIFHRGFLEFNFLFAFLMGFFTVRPRLNGESYELRYLGMLLALFVYFLLTGHRVSIFFVLVAFYIIPVAAILVISKAGRLRPSSNTQQLKRVIAAVRAAAPFVLLAIFLIVGWALYNSLYNVRSYADPVQAFVQRTLVQPTEFWWAVWSQSILPGLYDPQAAFDYMFVNPIDPSRNTGIQYLMVREMGYDRAVALLALGETLAGGYPEVLFELLGPVWAWPAMAIFAVVTVNFLRLAMVAVCNQHIATAIFAVFLFYGFSILYIGGMLNFLLAPTLALKFIGLGVSHLVEKRQHRKQLASLVR